MFETLIGGALALGGVFLGQFLARASQSKEKRLQKLEEIYELVGKTHDWATNVLASDGKVGSTQACQKLLKEDYPLWRLVMLCRLYAPGLKAEIGDVQSSARVFARAFHDEQARQGLEDPYQPLEPDTNPKKAYQDLDEARERLRAAVEKTFRAHQ